MVANIMDAKGGAEGRAQIENIRRYLEIFMNALSKRGEYKDIVSGWDIDFFIISAQLHDVGKIAVDHDILNKSGGLTDDEYEKVKSHADYGVMVIQQISSSVHNDAAMRHAEAITGSHHEKWDGSGYPLGLKGKSIPLQGRIMAIMDVYEALVNDRPHRVRKMHAEAVEIIKGYAGTHFDPDLINVFLGCEGEIEKIGM